MSELRVYLDHLIARESFRYIRPAEEMRGAIVQSPARKLTLKNLQDQSRAKLLRKPDFQRATWAWSPEDCVLLLESIVKDQIVPSIIMWSSPANGLDYILDGGHRVSVALAWLYDEWGDGPEADLRAATDEQAHMIRRAAAHTKALVQAKVGTIDEYRQAEQDLYSVITSGGNPSQVLDQTTFKRGLFYQNLLKDNVGFDIQYVIGDYKIAEDSFLKINKSGRALTDWERLLIENRNSSFARTVMAIANVKSMRHYWPEEEIPDDAGNTASKEKVNDIINNVLHIHDSFLTPELRLPLRSLYQPFLVASVGDQRAFYLAQLLTIISGGKGSEAESDELLRRDSASSPPEIIQNGWLLTEEAVDTLRHLWTPDPNNPEERATNKSLALVPTVYYYTNAGRPVRGLLYGLIYWLLSGEEDQIRDRKRIFSAYRGAFEQVFIESKEDLISAFSRNIGSGAEITIPVSRYFQRLQELLINHRGEITAEPFQTAYSSYLSELLGGRGRGTTPSAIRSRTFSPRQKTITVLGALLRSSIRCEICNGILDPTGPTQHDHITPSAKGGTTEVSNERLTHPFCNQNREQITSIKAGTRTFVLPPFTDPELNISAKQLRLFDESFLNSE